MFYPLCTLRNVTNGLRRHLRLLAPWATRLFRSECCTGGESMAALVVPLLLTRVESFLRVDVSQLCVPNYSF